MLTTLAQSPAAAIRPAPGSGFGAPDWAVLGVYFLLLAVTGCFFSRAKPKDTDDYFLGGRRMPAWAVAISIVATSLSAVTFIGVPQSSYKGDLTYLATNIGMIIAALVIAFAFIPVFYRSRSASIYEHLETRFGAPSRKAASVAFMIGRVLASGARIYAGAIPASIVLFGFDRGTDPRYLIAAIGILTCAGIIYTLAGGISSVIWSDVIQFAILISAALCAIVLIARSFTAPLPEILAQLRIGGPNGSSKLALLDFSLDPAHPYSLPACVIGFTLLGIGSYGTDQDLAQRMLTCKDAKQGARSVITGILLGIPTVTIFLIVGLLLWIVYQRPGLTNLSSMESPADSTTVFLQYIMTRIPPGVRGLMMAGLFAAGLSSLNSAINAMGAAFVSDLYRPWVTARSTPPRSEQHFVTVGRIAVVVWGLILGAFACVCIVWRDTNNQTLIDFALSVMGLAYAGLVGVFFAALFTRRGSNASVIAALGAGFAWMLITQPFVYDRIQAIHAPWVESFYGVYFVWKLTIGVAISLGVCMLGNRSQPAPAGASSAAPRAA